MKTRFHSLLEGKINAVIAKETQSLIHGGAVTHEGYHAMVGYIRGLEDALKLADDTEGELTG